MKKFLFLMAVGLFISFGVCAATPKTFKSKRLSPDTKAFILQVYKAEKSKKMVLFEPSFLSASCTRSRSAIARS